MKQSIPPAVAVAVALVVVIVVVAVGYFVFLKPKGGSSDSPDDIQAMQSKGQQYPERTQQSGGGAPPGGLPGAPPGR